MPILSRTSLVAGGLLLGTALTACVSQSSYDALQAENARLQQQAASNEAAIAEGKIQVSRLQGAIKYTVESDLLFAPGSWQLSEDGKRTMASLSSQLAPTQRNTIVVNGYTDTVPIGRELQQKGVTSNKELSEKRAEAVRDFLVSQGVNPNLVTAVGHGSSNPIATNDTAKGRSENRRVELTLGG